MYVYAIKINIIKNISIILKANFFIFMILYVKK